MTRCQRRRPLAPRAPVKSEPVKRCEMSTIFVEFGGAANQRPILSALIKRCVCRSRPGARVDAGSRAADCVSGVCAWRAWLDRGRSGRGRVEPGGAGGRASASRRSEAHACAIACAARSGRGRARRTATRGVEFRGRCAHRLRTGSAERRHAADGGTRRGDRRRRESERPLQLAAHTDFVHLMAFLRGLSDLPVLIVPVDVTVKREGDSLAVSAALRVFSALRPVASNYLGAAFVDESLDADDQEDIVFFDPFAVPSMFVGGDLPDVVATTSGRSPARSLSWPGSARHARRCDHRRVRPAARHRARHATGRARHHARERRRHAHARR